MRLIAINEDNRRKIKMSFSNFIKISVNFVKENTSGGTQHSIGYGVRLENVCYRKAPQIMGAF